MGDHDDRPVGGLQAAEDVEHVGGVDRVERPGRLVGEDHERVGHDGACQGDTLLLPAGHLDRSMVGPLGQTQAVQRGQGALVAFIGPEIAVEKGRLHVSERGQMRDEVELLEHESDRVPTEPGAGRIVEGAHVLPGDTDDPRGGQVEHAEQAQHGGLPGPRGPDDGHEVARKHPEGHVAQRVDLDLLAVDA